MNILVFEWMNGGGHWIDGTQPDNQCPFQEQGLLMVQAVCEDIVSAGHTPLVPVDSRLIDEIRFNSVVRNVVVPLPNSKREATQQRLELLDSELRSWIGGFDRALLIAPESNGCLMELVTIAERLEYLLLGPSASVVSLTSDKTVTSELLSKRGVATPMGCRLDRLEHAEVDFSGSVILKPNFGSGAEAIRIFDDVTRFRQFVEGPQMQYVAAKEWRVEQLLQGRPVSVSVIGGHNRPCKVLPPTGQVFDGSTESHVGKYVGAEYPLPKGMAGIIQQTARRVVESLPSFHGYLGIDMVFDSESQTAAVIDINPRLTSSYHRLRQIVDDNIFQLILESVDS